MKKYCKDRFSSTNLIIEVNIVWAPYVPNLTIDQGSPPSAGGTLQEITLPSPWEVCRTLKGLQVFSVSGTAYENMQGFSTSSKTTGTLTILQKRLCKLSHDQKENLYNSFSLKFAWKKLTALSFQQVGIKYNDQGK